MFVLLTAMEMEERLIEMRRILVEELPTDNYFVLKYVIHFLTEVLVLLPLNINIFFIIIRDENFSKLVDMFLLSYVYTTLVCRPMPFQERRVSLCISRFLGLRGYQQKTVKLTSS